MEAAAAEELLGFLGPESRPEAKGRAVRFVLGLTGSAEGRRLLLARPGLLEALLALGGEAAPTVARDALAALVNLAAAEPGEAAGRLRRGLPGLLRGALELPDSPAAGPACALLANLSREAASGRALLGAGLLPALVEALGTAAPAQQHLAGVLCNLSRLPEGREALLDPSRCLVRRLLAFTQDAGSAVRRQGVVGALRNCCFDYRHHEWLLSAEVDLLPFLLLPLAGPEELPEDEMERLPLDLQYLSPEKQREPVADIRQMLLEALLLLTATKAGRQVVREKGAYLILRELHRWEADPGARAACEKVIQVLISDEPEAGMENLLEVEIPAEVERQLQCSSQEGGGWPAGPEA